MARVTRVTSKVQMLLMSLLVTVRCAAIVEADIAAETFFRVISSFSQKHPSWRPNASLSSWAGVSDCPGPNCAFECRDDATREMLGGAGALDLSSLRTFNYFTFLDFSNCSLLGSVDLTDLPTGLVLLGLPQNNFSGTVNLRRLPNGRRLHINLCENQFSGTLDLSSLPQSFDRLSVCLNRFSGSVNLSGLPNGMRELTLSRNKFTGVLDLRGIPASLQVAFEGNAFTSVVGRSSGPVAPPPPTSIPKPTPKPTPKRATATTEAIIATIFGTIAGVVVLTVLVVFGLKVVERIRRQRSARANAASGSPVFVEPVAAAGAVRLEVDASITGGFPAAPQIAPVDTDETGTEDVEVPPQFMCPITYSWMRRPTTLLADGNTYERDAITTWVRDHGTSPLTRAPATLDQLVPDAKLWSEIETWRAAGRCSPPPPPPPPPAAAIAAAAVSAPFGAAGVEMAGVCRRRSGRLLEHVALL